MGQTGCLLLHGFTGGAYEVNPLARYLREHTDWIISVPVLPGHGRHLDLRQATAMEWLLCAEEELERLLLYCDEVYVVGFSMGGLIASYLTIHYPVSKLVLLSAAALYINPRQIFQDMNGMMKDAIRRTLHENEWFGHYKYKVLNTPIRSAWEFRKLASHMVPLLSKIRVPVFIAQGQMDGIVPPRAARFVYDRVGTYQKKLYLSKGSKHLICYGPDCDDLFHEIAFFLKQDEHPDDG
ncbi:carboxylesterase [Jeotgalibacillus sp. R-1-5s-1]|uniref:alpha/beta hydrolase n=1 Tax=Jeotgalibacillus sp. R-1-5s-1 TaxID=2555897 RepID=UPI00106A1CAF|nr:alpha/beta fold hydrolase [Jeotgalibacillus sp. R-1-5s-1]TFD98292.1 alpha/beta fold hydrolase [Jeotgalibacillus sp. R-1-5s-1]